MKLEDQVCSLELAKRLKELDVKQGSLFYWVRPRSADLFVCWFWEKLSTATGETAKWEQISAFTVAELGKMLPDSGLDAIHRTMGGTWSCYRNNGNSKDEEINEADARANMLIYFIEEGLVKP